MAAERKEPSEVDRLLAEVDGMLGDGPRRSVQPHGPAEPASRPLVGRVRSALVAGAAAGVGVWVLFALLPFLRAGSGGVGAFLATFVAVLLLPRRRS
jgi:hypothetical protein